MNILIYLWNYVIKQFKAQSSKYRPFRARPALFSLCAAYVSLAEIEGSFDGKSRFGTPDAAKAPDVLASGSQQNLPITRAAITARFLCFSDYLTFNSPKSEFHLLKVTLSIVQNQTFIYPKIKTLYGLYFC